MSLWCIILIFFENCHIIVLVPCISCHAHVGVEVVLHALGACIPPYRGRTADADLTIWCMVEVHFMWKGGYTSTRYMVYFLLWELQHARGSPARTCTKAMACPCACCLGHASLVWTASLGRVGDSGCICVHLCFLIFTICMWDNPPKFLALVFQLH